MLNTNCIRSYPSSRNSRSGPRNAAASQGVIKHHHRQYQITTSSQTKEFNPSQSQQHCNDNRYLKRLQAASMDTGESRLPRKIMSSSCSQKKIPTTQQMQCTSVFDCYQILNANAAANRVAEVNSKLAPVLQKTGQNISMTGKARHSMITKSMSQTCLTQVNGHVKRPGKCSQLDIIPERINSINRRKAYIAAPIASQEVSLPCKQSAPKKLADAREAIKILKKVNSCSFNGMSEMTKADSYCTTELRSRETSPTSHLFHSKLSNTECSSPSPVREARRKNKAPRALPPNEIMKRRWEYKVSERIPYCDQTDIFQLSSEPAPRQFAPEYSQQVYMNMLKQERAIGDYFKYESCQLGFPIKARETMIQLMEELHHARNYNEITLHVAVGIADRYLAHLA